MQKEEKGCLNNEYKFYKITIKRWLEKLKVCLFAMNSMQLDINEEIQY